ncbi:uncharacterized protein LOC129893067 [Solanum dulcamara]|uniref:uncharacterized protein LOC129893067 n=1 Tax=Solanum dulcamara TaxID=45834 RepID=UPI0024854EF2|nr:uncharacterized protein LOC129893067 [Solanum dulcamara]
MNLKRDFNSQILPEFINYGEKLLCKHKGLYNGKVMEIDRESDGLYCLQEDDSIKGEAVIKDQTADSVLWHNGLGHPSMEVLNSITDLNVKMCKKNTTTLYNIFYG